MSDGVGSVAWRRAEAERLLGFGAGAAISGHALEWARLLTEGPSRRPVGSSHTTDGRIA